MANELAVVNNKDLRPAPAVLEFSSIQVKLLADTIAKGCDENELKLFLEIAKLKRLDPFSGQIRPVKRWDSEAKAYKMVIQTGIDGYRSTASRTDEMAGIDDAIFNSEEEDHPKWAKVTVYRWSHGEKIPYTATARWSEYVQKKQGGEPNSMWTRMPYLMLAKCAEALALRKAFPDELAGVYTDEEMGQADNIIEGQPEPPQLKPPVAMPQATKTEPVSEKIEGTIGAIKSDDQGRLWINVGGKAVGVPSAMVADKKLIVGAKIELHATKGRGEFWIADSVESVSDGFEDPLPPMPDGSAPAKEPDAMDKAIAEGKFDEKPLGTLEETRTGKVGSKRQTRLWTLMNVNKGKTGLDEKIVHKILDAIEPPVAHLADLEMGFYKHFEQIMTGEVDWKQFVGD